MFFDCKLKLIKAKTSRGMTNSKAIITLYRWRAWFNKGYLLAINKTYFGFWFDRHFCKKYIKIFLGNEINFLSQIKKFLIFQIKTIFFH